MFFNKAFNEIEYSDIEELVTQNVSENQNLEYKQEVWGKNDEEVREMLRDIAAMGNSYGGFIIIGVKENVEGEATEIVNVENFDQERDRIFSSCLVNLHPRINGLDVRCIGNGEKNLLILNIPQSYRSPHLITFKSLNQFWVRHDRQKSFMSVDEIKDSFLKNSSITKDINEFISGRKYELLNDLGKTPCFILGSYPLGVYEEIVNTRDQVLREKLKNPPYGDSGQWCLKFLYDNSRPTINGISIGGKAENYKEVELFRNGFLEARIALDNEHFVRNIEKPNGETTPLIYGYALVEYVYSFIDQMMNIYSYLGLNSQCVIYCSFLNIKGFALREYRPNTHGYDRNETIWDKDNLIIDSLSFDHFDKDKIAKHITDRIWQAFNFDGSDNFYRDELFDRSLWH